MDVLVAGARRIDGSIDWVKWWWLWSTSLGLQGCATWLSRLNHGKMPAGHRFEISVQLLVGGHWLSGERGKLSNVTRAEKASRDVQTTQTTDHETVKRKRHGETQPERATNLAHCLQQKNTCHESQDHAESFSTMVLNSRIW